MIRIDFEHLRFNGDPIASWSDAILRVTAELKVQVGDVVVYQEWDVPVVELAYQLHRWIVCDTLDGTGFEYHSMESADNPLIWIRETNGTWMWGSRFQERNVQVDRNDVDFAVRTFISDLDTSAREVIGLHLLSVLLDPTGTPLRSDSSR